MSSNDVWLELDPGSLSLHSDLSVLFPAFHKIEDRVPEKLRDCRDSHDEKADTSSKMVRSFSSAAKLDHVVQDECNDKSEIWLKTPESFCGRDQEVRDDIYEIEKMESERKVYSQDDCINLLKLQQPPLGEFKLPTRACYNFLMGLLTTKEATITSQLFSQQDLCIGVDFTSHSVVNTTEASAMHPDNATLKDRQSF